MPFKVRPFTTSPLTRLWRVGYRKAPTVRISGKLLPDSFYRETEGTVAHFSLVEDDLTLQATYDGIMPELFFNEHSDIVLEGSLNQDGIFNSDRVIVKCPTKYQAQA